MSDARYWTHNVPAEGESKNIDTNTFNAITSDYETLENGQIKEHFIGTNLAEVAAMTASSIKPGARLAGVCNLRKRRVRRGDYIGIRCKRFLCK